MLRRFVATIFSVFLSGSVISALTKEDEPIFFIPYENTQQFDISNYESDGREKRPYKMQSYIYQYNRERSTPHN